MSIFSCLKNLFARRCSDMGRDGAFSSKVLPALGARVDRAGKLRKRVISPYHPCYRAWETFLILLVIYSAWISPFQLSFLTHKHHHTVFMADNVVDAFFAGDVVLTFFVAYLSTHSYILIDDPKRIATRYLSSWFILDLCSTLPFQSLSIFFTHHQNTGLCFSLLSLLRLWRLRRVGALFARLEKDIRFSYFWTRCAKFVCVGVFVVHCGGCLNYMIADGYPDPRRTWIGSVYPDFKEMGVWDRYVAAIYWSIVTVTTTGYGDFHPQNPPEMLFTVAFMLFNVGLASYLVGNITNLVLHWTASTANFVGEILNYERERSRDNVVAASEFMRRNQLPPVIQHQILSHLYIKFSTRALQCPETLRALPNPICRSVSRYLFYPVLQNVGVFHGVSQDFLLQLGAEMEAEYYPPGEDVIHQNEASTDAFILLSGSAECIAKINGHDQVIGKAGRGEMLGEIGIVCGKAQAFSVRTTDISQIMRLNKTVFLNILRKFPEDRHVFVNNLSQKWKECRFLDAENLYDPSLILTRLTKQESTTDILGSNSPSTVRRGRLETPKTRVDEGIYECEKITRRRSEKRITIHINIRNEKQRAKVIILPHSLRELLRIAGEKFGDRSFARVVNAENARVDDLSVIRDGDHLFLHPSDDSDL